MNWHASSLENLRRIFVDGFAARDIAEPLASFDTSSPATEIIAFAQAKDFDVVGIRNQGHVIGYVTRGELENGSDNALTHSIEEAAIISDNAGLADVIVRLKDAPRLFVRTLGAIHGIVTQSDLQKPAVRMWLFGMVTLVEMRMSRLVEQLCEGESWTQYLSEGRLQKAAALLEERRRRSQNLALIDCLQFSDKVQIVARNESIRSLTRFTSRRQVEETCKLLESLRNNLAHAQDIIANDWPTIIMLATASTASSRAQKTFNRQSASDNSRSPPTGSVEGLHWNHAAQDRHRSPLPSHQAISGGQCPPYVTVLSLVQVNVLQVAVFAVACRPVARCSDAEDRANVRGSGR